MQEEIWKDVPGYEGIYQVSNLGRVKSLSRIVKRGTKHCHIIGKILSYSFDKRGYPVVGISLENTRKTKTVHQLLADAFLNHKTDGTHRLVIDHINNIKTDNRPENLQIITNRENCSKDTSSTSKYTGVCWDKFRNKWRANIKINGKQVHLGRFNTELEAHEAYQNKLKEILINK